MGSRMARQILAALLFAAALAAQSTETYRTRLSAVAADARTRAALAGTGTATASLSGSKLTVNGSFDGLLSPATSAQLRIGVAAGVRGPVIQDLTVSKSTSGMLSGSVDLTADQIEKLHKGGIYIQIASEKAPEGVLWGWFLNK